MYCNPATLICHTGSWHEMKDGEKRPYSLATNYDPLYSVPVQYDARVSKRSGLDREVGIMRDLSQLGFAADCCLPPASCCLLPAAYCMPAACPTKIASRCKHPGLF